jgi:hypothetical protein
VPATKPGTALTPNGIQLIDENEARGVLFRILKEISNPRGTDTHKHFHKLGSANAKKRHPSFSSHCPGQQGFPCTRRPYQEDALGDFRPQIIELLGVFEKLYDLDQFLFGLIHSGHMVESDPPLVLLVQTGSALTKGHGTIITALHLIHDKQPDQGQHNNKKQVGKKGHPPWCLRRQFSLQLNISLLQSISHIRHFAHGD